MTYEFLSPGWLAALHGIISERVTQAAKAEPDLTFSVCETAHRPPAHLSADGGALSWCCKVVGGAVTFSTQADDDVDLRVVGDYHALASLAPLDTAGDPAREADLRQRCDALVAAGRIVVIGAAVRPASIGSFHDAIARLTR